MIIKKKRREKKKNKGFTLVELLAVIVILAVVMVVTIPTVIGSINKAKEKAFNTSVKAVQNYIDKQIEKCEMKNQLLAPYEETIFLDTSSCTINSAQSNKILEKAGYENEVDNIVLDNNKIIYGEGKENFSKFEYNFDTSNANKPDLTTGLVPIKYNKIKSKWVVTTDDDPNWYNYSMQRWANAVSLKSSVSKTPGTELDIENDAYAMFVWIPRYSYTIGCKDQTDNINLTSDKCLGYKIDGASDLSLNTPGAIDIKFISQNTKEKYDGYEENITGKSPTYNYDGSNRTPLNWYTHPAFTFGDQELSGIWVGKFETSGSSSTPTILPNATPLTSQTISEQFTTAQQFTANTSTYGLIGDAHMMKNSEWGAVAYLSQSIYGKYGNSNYTDVNKEIYKNNSSMRYTGRSGGTPNIAKRSKGYFQYDGTSNYEHEGIDSNILSGTGASTTGNIYGIYDMSGGSVENVMGNYNKNIGESGFSSLPESKYYDNLPNEIRNLKDNTTNGGAFVEVAGWYSDQATNNFYDGLKQYWISRGGLSTHSPIAGIFYSYSEENAGSVRSNFSFRTSLIGN